MLGVTSHCNIPDFKSSSKKVQDVLVEDRHPLAKLSRGALTATHATCQDGRWFMNDLRTSLDRIYSFSGMTVNLRLSCSFRVTYISVIYDSVFIAIGNYYELRMDVHGGGPGQLTSSPTRRCHRAARYGASNRDI